MRIVTSAAAVLLAACAAEPPQARDWSQCDVTALQRAMLDGTLTARDLLADCRRRIAADEAAGRGVGAFVHVVAGADADAAAADSHLARTGRLIGPLHGIPIAIKDNIDVAGTPTSLGLTALAAALPPADAECVARIRRAGGIVFAKTNLATLARSSRETVSEIAGRTRNPRAPDHTIGGSSGGSAAAVAAGYVPLAIGTDTGASIRGPAAHAGIVGIRPAFGTVPTAGVAPLYVARDTVGSFARRIADATRLLGVMAADPRLVEVAMAPPRTRLEAVVGVVTALASPARSDPEVLLRFEGALEHLRHLGITLVPLDDLLGAAQLDFIPVDAERFPRDLDAFLTTRLPPHDHLRAVDLIPHSTNGSRAADDGSKPRRRAPFDATSSNTRTEALRAKFEALWQGHHLAAIVYPTWSRAPLPLAAGRAPNGDNSGYLVPPLGLPAVTVPMGTVRGGLPTGIEFVGRPGSDFGWLEIASAFEREFAAVHGIGRDVEPAEHRVPDP